MTKSASKPLIACTPTQTQWPAVHRAIFDAFGAVSMPDDIGARDHLRPEKRRVAITDEGRVCGGAFAYDYQLGLPGGARVPVAGLAGVGVSPPDQGRGGLRIIMQRHLEDSRALGDAGSVLMASESGLYRRFGYGAATEMVQWHLNTLQFSVPADIVEGYCVRLVQDRSEAMTVLASLYEQSLQSNCGGIERTSDWWEQILHSGTDSWVARGSQFVAVVFDAKNRACGYALYKIDERSETETGHGRLMSICRVSELCALNAQAETALFKYLSSIAMIRELVWEVAPINPAVRYFMKDPRQLWQQARLDMMWLRPLDLPALLCNRTYGLDGDIVIDYCDPLFEDLCNVWKLSIRNGGAVIEKIPDFNRANRNASPNATPYVALDSEALGCVLLGGTRVVDLARVNGIRGSEGSLALFDRLMLCDTVPFNLHKF